LLLLHSFESVVWLMFLARCKVKNDASVLNEAWDTLRDLASPSLVLTAPRSPSRILLAASLFPRSVRHFGDSSDHARALRRESEEDLDRELSRSPSRVGHLGDLRQLVDAHVVEVRVVFAHETRGDMGVGSRVGGAIPLALEPLGCVWQRNQKPSRSEGGPYARAGAITDLCPRDPSTSLPMLRRQ
jgi:hypothetical protein